MKNNLKFNLRVLVKLWYKHTLPFLLPVDKDRDMGAGPGVQGEGLDLSSSSSFLFLPLPSLASFLPPSHLFLNPFPLLPCPSSFPLPFLPSPVLFLLSLLETFQGCGMAWSSPTACPATRASEPLFIKVFLLIPALLLPAA